MMMTIVIIVIDDDDNNSDNDDDVRILSSQKLVFLLMELANFLCHSVFLTCKHKLSNINDYSKCSRNSVHY